jgi:hypothetical protein
LETANPRRFSQRSMCAQEVRGTSRFTCSFKAQYRRATVGSAERDQVLAHDTNQVWRVSGLSSLRASFPGCFRQVRSQSKEEGFVRRSLHARLNFLPQGQGQTSTLRQAPRLSQEALPNPSLKPSPNSKPPGRRYSAGLHFLQRRPGVSLSVPA